MRCCSGPDSRRWQGRRATIRLYALLAPHLANQGRTTPPGSVSTRACRCSSPSAMARAGPGLLDALAGRSVGFVGASDGWQDLSRNKRLTRRYERAEDGNVALTGEVDLGGRAASSCWRWAWAQSAEAGHRASPASPRTSTRSWKRMSASGGLAATRSRRRPSPSRDRPRDLYRISMAVLRTHESKNIPGGIIASLSIPWGFARADDDLGGYHLVWPRDLVEAAGGLFAAGGMGDAHRMLGYLQVTQEADGHWPQNMWLAGDRLLERHPAGRDGAADPARRPGPPRGHAPPRGPGPLLADGPQGRRATWSGTARRPAGPLGEGRRLHPVHPGGRDRRAARRRRPRRHARRARAGDLPARDGRRLERQHRGLALRHRHRPGPRGRRRRAITSASSPPENAVDARRRHGIGHGQEPPAGRRTSGPPTPWSAPTPWRWSGSASARPTTRGSSTP